MRLAKDFQGALSPQYNQQGGRASHWSLPPLGFHKVNVDGATSLDGASSCIGVIICDSSRHVTAAMSKPLLAHYPPETVDVLAVESGVILAHEMNISWVIFESDSLATVQSENAMESGRSLGHILSGIHSSLLHFNN